MGVEQLAAQIREHGTAGRAVRPVGGGTKLGWGTPGPDGAIDVETSGLNEIAEHNVGDFTAVLEAGVPLATAQETFAAEGQMLALDPPADPGALRRAPAVAIRSAPPRPPARAGAPGTDPAPRRTAAASA